MGFISSQYTTDVCVCVCVVEINMVSGSLSHIGNCDS